MLVVNLFLAARRAFADWRRRQRNYAELMALDDRSLADIGVRRSQIPVLVFGTAKPRTEAEPQPGPSEWLPVMSPRV